MLLLADDLVAFGGETNTSDTLDNLNDFPSFDGNFDYNRRDLPQYNGSYFLINRSQLEIPCLPENRPPYQLCALPPIYAPYIFSYKPEPSYAMEC